MPRRRGVPRLTPAADEAPKTNPSTPTDQAAALSGSAEKKVGPYKTLQGAQTRPRTPLVALRLHGLGLLRGNCGS